MTNHISQCSLDSLIHSLRFLECIDVIQFTLTCTEFHRLAVVSQSPGGDQKSISYLWYQLYVNLCAGSSCKYSPMVPWVKKVKEIQHFISSPSPFNFHLCDTDTQQQFFPRSGHSLNKLNGIYLQFGGATVNYDFTDTYDILSVSAAGDIHPWCVNLPLQFKLENDGKVQVPSRWLHTGSTISSSSSSSSGSSGSSGSSRVVIYGGQGSQGRIRSDMYSIQLGVFEEVKDEALEIFQDNLLQCKALQQEGKNSNYE